MRFVALVHGWPFSRISPSTPLFRPEMQSRSELLPAPDGPMMTSSSPGFAEPLTLFRITFSSVFFVAGFFTSALRLKFLHWSVNLAGSGANPRVLGVSLT
ncbi:uncharacterized protein PITG_04292 [Phytophthora infestans T30-4]|uniref:Transmembrane protein n=1 Tax=Phytophthora infestans (strain T30-4) TaxID=403677 RepID=D0N0Y4_PHYIT|nr:uncharacterized protein PITG_04292 [Phytophthora infestans T30-4]EEY67297.1 hypothetical protein PITG_04292 [Phytophthora infestans T30-4]|eukprot:XP_002905945.1 hypothetical protein PITG_04292 [Phytophthora infestans T30-4]